MATTKEIATTILSQIEEGYTGTLNGVRMSALKLLGADSFSYGDNSVQFKVKGSRKLNTVVVKLNEMDTYDVEFHLCKIVMREPYVVNKKVAEVNDVYFDELSKVIVEKVLYE